MSTFMWKCWERCRAKCPVLNHNHNHVCSHQPIAKTFKDLIPFRCTFSLKKGEMRKRGKVGKKSQVTAKLITLLLKTQVNWFVWDTLIPKVRSIYEKREQKTGQKLSTSIQSNFNWYLVKEYVPRWWYLFKKNHNKHAKSFLNNILSNLYCTILPSFPVKFHSSAIPSIDLFIYQFKGEKSNKT